MKFLKKYAAPLLMMAVFETVSVVLWLLMDNIFYLFKDNNCNWNKDKKVEYIYVFYHFSYKA